MALFIKLLNLKLKNAVNLTMSLILWSNKYKLQIVNVTFKHKNKFQNNRSLMPPSHCAWYYEPAWANSQKSSPV